MHLIDTHYLEGFMQKAKRVDDITTCH